MNAAPNHGLLGRSAEIESLRRLIDKASRNHLPVLLLGESGTGKEVAARAIHNAAPRGQFVPIDCGSLVGTLMESELFGHVKGSFSGAAENKKGLVEMADGGTAFFDEIGDMPMEMQVKLLRVVQEREFRAVGSTQWRKLDLRIIAATHRDLKAEVAAGRFRQDLYYRLNVFTVHLPPLRHRKEDIHLLVEHFLNGYGFHPSREILNVLESYDWPGNVRELKHCVERMAAMRSEGALQMADLPSALQYHQVANGQVANGQAANGQVANGQAANGQAANGQAGSGLARFSDAVGWDRDLPQFALSPPSPVISLPQSERQTIGKALAATRGERTKAARLLGIGRTTLYRKMKEYGFD